MDTTSDVVKKADCGNALDEEDEDVDRGGNPTFPEFLAALWLHSEHTALDNP